MSTTLDQWDQVDQQEESISLEQMDALILQLKELKAASEAAQEKADAEKATYNEHRDLVLKTLRANNRQKYSVDGVAMVYISDKEVYTVPKTIEQKTALFNYIKDTYGADALMAMVGIHSATLTSWANQESDKGVMQIPGLEAPTMISTLNVRKN